MSLVLPAAADIQVGWGSSGPIFVAGSGTQIPADLLPEGATFQLIWSPDMEAGEMDPDTPLVPTGNDLVIDTRLGLQGGFANSFESYGDAASPPVLPGGGNNGFVYGRVFSDSTATPLFFAQTHLIATQSGSGLSLPVGIDFAVGLGEFSGVRTNVELINPNGDPIIANVVFVNNPVLPGTPVPDPLPEPELPPPVPEEPRAVRILVWLDADQNGRPDFDEVNNGRLEGVQVVVSVDDGVDESYLTDADGYISVPVFESLTARLVRTSLAPWLDGRSTPTTQDAEVYETILFGVFSTETEPEPSEPEEPLDPEPETEPDPVSFEPGLGEVLIIVWEDVNQDGIPDAAELSENGMEDVNVVVSLDTGEVRSYVDGGDGRITVRVSEFLDASLVGVSLPPGLTGRSTPTDQRAEVNGVILFGVFRPEPGPVETEPEPDPDPIESEPGTVRILVWEDVNQNGVPDNTELDGDVLNGIWVYTRADGGVTRADRTGTDGWLSVPVSESLVANLVGARLPSGLTGRSTPTEQGAEAGGIILFGVFTAEPVPSESELPLSPEPAPEAVAESGGVELEVGADNAASTNPQVEILVWVDANANGIPDEDLSGMAALEGIRVEVFVDMATTSRVFTTDANGRIFVPADSVADAALLEDSLPPEFTRRSTNTRILGEPGGPVVAFGVYAGPTAVGLERVEIVGNTVRWDVAWEENMIGYWLYQEVGDGFQLAHETLILAGGGGRYELEVDDPNAVFSLRELTTDLEEVELARFANATPLGEPVAQLDRASPRFPADARSVLLNDFKGGSVQDVSDPEHPIDLLVETLRSDGADAAYLSWRPGSLLRW